MSVLNNLKGDVKPVSVEQNRLIDFKCKMRNKKIPIRGSFDLTYRCNLKCIHCYIPDSFRREELPYDDVCQILDEASENGCIWLQLTGGEPLVRCDFLDIYTYAVRKGMRVSIDTNGTLITSKIVNYLQELPPYYVEISLHGNTQRTHESITRQPGSFENCIHGINLLVEAGISVKLKTIIMTINKDEICDMAENAHGLGVEFMAYPGIIPRLDGSKEPCRLRVSPKDVVSLVDADVFSIPTRHSGIRAEYFTPCDAGISSFHIDAYGNLTNCITMRIFNYSLLHGTFQEGWRKLSASTRVPTHKGADKCLDCELRSECEQCPGWAYLEHGAVDVPIEYMCSIRKLQHSLTTSSLERWDYL